MKKDKSDSLKKIMNSLNDYAEERKYSLLSRTPAMKARDKLVVCKSFHGAGIVVPVDENEVGYRPVPETPG